MILNIKDSFLHYYDT